MDTYVYVVDDDIGPLSHIHPHLLHVSCISGPGAGDLRGRLRLLGQRGDEPGEPGGGEGAEAPAEAGRRGAGGVEDLLGGARLLLAPKCGEE